MIGLTRPKLCLVAATPLTMHFFFRPHLEQLSDDFDLTVVFNHRLDSYLPPLGVSGREFHVSIERKISPWRDLRALWQLTTLFKEERFDVVVTLVPKAGLLGLLAAFMTRCPVRLHLFQGEVWASRSGAIRSLLKLIDILIARLATHVLAVSASEKQYLEDQGVVPANYVRVLGEGSVCGVNTKRFSRHEAVRASMRAALLLPNEAIVCLFLGRLTVDKGILDLAAAYAVVATDLPTLWLLVAGPDEESMVERLMAVIPESMQSRVHVIGFSTEPEKILAAADFICLPSYREGFGMVILEAAAMGLTAIGSDIYGIRDAIVDAQTGLLTPVGDIESLADAIKRLAVDHHFRDELGRAAQIRALAHFEESAVVSSYVEYIKSIAVNR